MATFIYKAKKGPSNVVEGSIDAENQADAINKLTFMGYFPISVTPAGSGVAVSRKSAPSKKPVPQSSGKPAGQPKDRSVHIALFQRITIRDLGAFTRQLADLLDSGVTLYRSVQILYEQCTNPPFKKVLGEIQQSIKDGNTLHESLSRHPKVFSSLFVNMVKSGEIGGMLEAVLERLADFTEQEDETRSKIKSAMVYPMLMGAVGILMIVILLTFVIPRLVKLFTDMGQALPLPTQILITISTIMSEYWWMTAIGIALAIYLFKRWKQTDTGAYMIDKLKLRIPVIHDLVLKNEIARFGRTLSTLLNNGVPILQSLSIIVDTIDNRVVRAEIKDAIDDISKGAKLGECLRRSTIFPALFVNMVAVGEESGHVEKSLEKVAESYDKQVDRAIKVFTTMLEPVMIVVLGAVLGAIVISIILPIFDISNIAK
ncbi:MAG: type II secretion system F family protein [Candidatus Auribacterota bacterium]|jgi:type II secretory pathway component PulF|nr:type II secretion system F family protein [Candidatus Auribacterota bacterium]